MREIADWLEKLGMSEYAQRFAENRIDLSVLPDLTDQHLKDLGVALGDRLKMLRAIGQLTGVSPAAPQFPAATKPAQQDTAERRQVTVMFSDLVGSTALSARMDPEDLGRSFRPIRSALPRPCSGSVGSWRSTWAMVCWSTLATRRPTRTMPSVP